MLIFRQSFSILAVLLLGLSQHSLAQVTYTVDQTDMIFRPPPDGCSPSRPTHCTLVEAIIAAAESPGLDYIQLPPEEIDLVSTVDVMSPISLSNNPLVIRGQTNSVINGLRVPGICFVTNTTLILINVNIKNCPGYAVFVADGPIGILNSVFEGNGGALATRDANVAILGSTIVSNRSRLQDPPLRIDAEPWNSKFFLDQNSIYDSNLSDTFGVVQIKNMSRVTFNGSRFLGNTSNKSGGAVYLDNIGTGRLTTINTIFDGNSARGQDSESGRGGALFIKNYVTSIQRSIFTNNEAFSHGGAVFGDPARSKSITVESSLFDSNRSGANGGAMEIQGDKLKVSDSYFVSNRATESGGGIGFPGSTDATINSGIEIIRSGFRANVARQGGGIYSTQSPLSILQSYFLENSATIGGGLAAGSKNFPVKIENATFSQNAFRLQSAQNEPHGSDLFINPFSGGTCLFCTVVAVKAEGANLEAGNESSFKFINSYLWSTCRNITSEFSLTRSPECTTPTAPLPLLREIDLLPIAAVGATWGHSPNARSLAINRVRTNDCGLAIDQAGRRRPSGARCEIGALEVATSAVTPNHTAVQVERRPVGNRRHMVNPERCSSKISKALTTKIKEAIESKSEASWLKICD